MDQDRESMTVELDLVSNESLSNAFSRIRQHTGEPEVLVYNAGYIEGRGSHFITIE